MLQLTESKSNNCNKLAKEYRGKEAWENSKNLEELILNAKCKIIDFGLGKDLKESEGITNSICGSPVTMAPEIWKNKLQGKFKEGYNYKVDIWSAGCIIFNILTNGPPFPGDDIEKICNKVLKNGQYYVPFFNEDKTQSDITVEALDLLNEMLRFDPDLRIDWEGIIAHPFLNTPASKQVKMLDFINLLDSRNDADQKILSKMVIKNGKTYGIVFDINEEPILIELAKHKGLMEQELEINKHLQMKFILQNNIEDYFQTSTEIKVTNKISNSFKKKDELDDLFEFYDIAEDFYFVFEDDEDGFVIVNQVKRKKSDSKEDDF